MAKFSLRTTSYLRSLVILRFSLGAVVIVWNAAYLFGMFKSAEIVSPMSTIATFVVLGAMSILASFSAYLQASGTEPSSLTSR